MKYHDIAECDRQHRKTAWQRFKDLFRSFVAFVFSKVGICVLVVGYLLLGAFAFQAIEAPAEAQIKYNVKDNRTNTGPTRILNCANQSFVWSYNRF